MVGCEKNTQLTAEDGLVLGLLALQHDDLSEVVFARQVRSEELRRQALGHVDEVCGAVARVRRCHPAHLPGVVAVLRQGALVDADPLESPTWRFFMVPSKPLAFATSSNASTIFLPICHGAV